jgi:SNF2 family DNA or RNA helicase
MTTFEEWLDENKLKHEPHQKIAVEWCVKRELVEDIKGGIIADEMGLGKTIEILGTMICNPVPNTLIVLPYCVLGQWNDIITKLFHRAPLVYHGSQRKRLTEEEIKLHPIVLTTYGLISEKGLVRGIDLAGGIHLAGGIDLANIKWSRIIYDEAHHLRNKNTAVHAGALRLKTDITWLMTGTPIQNSEKDLYNLFSLLGLKCGADMKTNTATYIRTYMLRRTKEEAGIVLPTCHSTNIEVPWKYIKEQKIAENIHARLSFSNLQGGEFVNDGPQSHFKLLSKAKKVCVLPKLLKKGGKLFRFIVEEEDEVEVEEEDAEDQYEAQDEAEHEDEAQDKRVKNLEIFNHSSKLESVIKAILERRDNGKPKLVFCYFHKEIDDIAKTLKQHGLCVKKIDGRTSKQERAKILQRPAEVLIGQIDATNEGLNLQAYKEIYMVSPHWNPAVEDQAIARCHRIGQTEEVHVFHFLMTGFGNDESTVDAEEEAITLDQYICNVQQVKRSIVKNILDID